MPAGKFQKYKKNSKKQRQKTRSAQNKFALPKPRKQMVNQLSNILETKKFKGLDYNPPGGNWIENPIEEGSLPLTSAGVSFMPDSFYRMQFKSAVVKNSNTEDILADNCIEGTSIFSKYLQCKVQIDYPDGTVSPPSCPRPVEIIWGWVNPLNFTEFTTPTINEVTPAQIREHTLDAIANEFNSQTDPMEFHDKHRRRYNIIGRKKVVPKLMNQVPSRSAFGSPAGAAAARIHTDIKFPMMKKVNYTHSDAVGDASTPHFAYPNEAYLPFVYLYNPDFSIYDMSGVDPVKFKFNDCHWFNDA